MDISVVIPVRDQAELLAQALASVPAGLQTVVVDDGSCEKERERIRALPCDRLLRSARPTGPVAARNRGAALARGQTLLFLDADDLLEAQALPALFAALRQGDCVAAYGDTILADRQGRRRLLRSQACRQPEGDLRQPLSRVSFIGLGALLVRRRAFQQVEGFRELPIAEDWDLCRRLAALGPFARLRAPALRYRHLSGSRSRPPLKTKLARYRQLAAQMQREHPPASRYPLFHLLKNLLKAGRFRDVLAEPIPEPGPELTVLRALACERSGDPAGARERYQAALAQRFLRRDLELLAWKRLGADPLLQALRHPHLAPALEALEHLGALTGEAP